MTGRTCLAAAPVAWSTSCMPGGAVAQTREGPVTESREASSSTRVQLDFFSVFRRNKSPAKILSEKGPQFPLAFSMSAVQIVGFVKGDWPAVLDYELQPNALALLTVNSEGAEPYYFRLDPSGWQGPLSVAPIITAISQLA